MSGTMREIVSRVTVGCTCGAVLVEFPHFPQEPGEGEQIQRAVTRHLDVSDEVHNVLHQPEVSFYGDDLPTDGFTFGYDELKRILEEKR